MRVEVSRQATKSRVVSTAEVRAASEAMLRVLKLPKAELSVLLLSLIHI